MILIIVTYIYIQCYGLNALMFKEITGTASRAGANRKE
jgi:hypothetical protein